MISLSSHVFFCRQLQVLVSYMLVLSAVMPTRLLCKFVKYINDITNILKNKIP